MLERQDGALCASGNALGIASPTLQITAGQTTPIDVTMLGIVAKVSVSAPPLVPSGSSTPESSDEPLAVTGYDADGNAIPAVSGEPLSNPFVLTASDDAGAVSLSAGASPSCPGTSSITVTSAGQQSWLCYGGAPTSNVQISAAEAPDAPPGQGVTGGGY